MTEIKIPFIKTAVEKNSDPGKPANAEGLKLSISTIFRFDEVWEKVPTNTRIEKMKVAFWDSAETSVFNDLLDEDKVSFELSFEKEKVDFFVLGEENRDRDDTKVEIICLPGENGSLEIHFKPQSVGVVKITYQGPVKEPNKDKNNGGGNQNSPSDNSDDTNKKITNLQTQINTLEEKLRNQPTPDNSSVDKQKLARLKAEIEELKKKRKEKQNEGGNKDKFPYGLVIGGGAVIFLLLIAVIFF